MCSLQILSTIDGQESKLKKGLQQPTTYISGMFVGWQRNWATLTKEPYAIYMAFKSYPTICVMFKSLLNVICLWKWKVSNGPHFKPLSKQWGTEIAGMSHVKLEHIKVRVSILANCISRLKSIELYNFLSPEKHGRNLAMWSLNPYLLYR